MSVTAYIALGSNLGPREEHLRRTVELLELQPGIQVRAVSRWHETAPVGGPAGQGSYLNGVAELAVELSAEQLLRVLLSIESQQGRVRTERWGARTLDLDLLLYGHDVIDRHDPDCDLTVPHPRMHERAFVLEPLVEIAPLAVHPLLRSTAYDLLQRLRATSTSTPLTRELAGMNAVVTGSTSGIGRAIALQLARGGANVVIHGRRSRDAAEQTAQQCRDLGVDARVVLADLREAAGCTALANEAWEQSGGLDIWINNAGADTLTGDAKTWSFERKLDELWRVDVRATIQLSRDIGERMKRRGRGVILTMGWDQAETGMEGDSGQLFGAVKGAVMSFTKSLARSLAPSVRVNCLAPGWIRTAWGEHASDAWQQRVLRETPLQRWGVPDDIAGAARWLASPTAAFVTGQIIRVNGGAVCG
jgi:3-oxoacyl-[acyl-carrier protein] reductase